MRRCDARWPECTCVSMNPGHTSLPRASISASARPSNWLPTWTTRSASYTTTPSGTRVCVPFANPTTQPPRTSVFMSLLRERGVAGVTGRGLTLQEDVEVGGRHAVEAREEEIGEERARVRGLVRGHERRGQPRAGAVVHSGRGH